MKQQELPPRLKQLDDEMASETGPRYRHLYAVHDGQRFEIRIMRSPSNEFIATTLQKVGTYLIQGNGRRPSEAFIAITRAIKWNLRKSTQEMLSKSREAARQSIFVPVGR